ncbi:hypothetical protein MBLNU459_g5018t1 [Dothideomycetes sp. NU459]
MVGGARRRHIIIVTTIIAFIALGLLGAHKAPDAAELYRTTKTALHNSKTALQEYSNKIVPEMDWAAAKPRAYSKRPETGDGPRGKDVVLLMASDKKGNQGNSISYMHERAAENRKEYADWHGYTFYPINMSEIDFPAHAIWKKIPAIKQAFAANPEAKWVWWLDLDAIIMTAHIPLSTYLLADSVLEQKLIRNMTVDNINRTLSHEDLHAQDVNLIISQDGNGLNSGSMFFRRGDWTDMLLDAWTDPYVMEHHLKAKMEQDALVHLVDTYEEVANHTGLIEQHIFNAYAQGGPEMRWQEDDIAVHFAGCWVDKTCTARWERLWSMRSPVPKEQLKSPRLFP